MSAHDFAHHIPQHLDDPAKFLFWELDVAALALVGVLLGIAVDLPLGGLALGISLAAAYGQCKAGQHPGMALHLLAWFTGLPTPSDLPPSHWRELNG